MYNPYLPHLSKFDIFLQWLKDLGGSYDMFRADETPNPKRANYQPKPKLVFRPLNPKHYRVDGNGSVRKISKKGLEVAEKLGI
jgi:hypothetical protein